MPDSRKLAQAAIVILCAAGAAALFTLFQTSTESGELFPEYSSLRSDPLGTRILHDALTRLPGYQVERNFRPFPRFHPTQATVFVLNTAASSWTQATQKQLTEWEARARQGARLVFATGRKSSSFSSRLRARERKSAKPTQSAFEDRWKLRIVESSANPASWRLVPLDNTWTSLAVHRGKDQEEEITAAERRVEGGAIVFFGDSFLFSNEAQVNDRDPESLHAALGPHRRVIFDEAHLGTVETGSVGGLLRRYRLQGAAAVLVLLGALFVWRSSSSLLPRTGAGRDNTVAGRAAAEALPALLRRNLPPAAAPQALREIWEKSQHVLATISPERRRRIGAELSAASGSTLLETWNNAHHIAKRKS